jgi:F0F1-type ATP synthase assembly protein I
MSNRPTAKPQQYSLNMAVAITVGLGGFIVLAIVMATLAIGLVIDRALDTRPLFTIGLMVLSAPVSIFVMYRVATGIIAKSVAKPGPKTEQ